MNGESTATWQGEICVGFHCNNGRELMSLSGDKNLLRHCREGFA